VALALLFSVFTSAALSSICTVSLVVAGRFSDVIRNMQDVAPDTPRWLVLGLYYALPNFRNFDVKNRVVYGDPVSMADLGWITAYAALYMGVVLGAALAAFRRRELN